MRNEGNKDKHKHTPELDAGDAVEGDHRADEGTQAVEGLLGLLGLGLQATTV